MILLDSEVVDIWGWLILELISQVLCHLIFHVVDLILLSLHLLIVILETVDKFLLVLILFMGDCELSLFACQEGLIHPVLVLESRHFKSTRAIAVTVQLLMLSLTVA